MTPARLLAASIAVALTVPALARGEEPVRPTELIQQAVHDKARRVVIPPGTYRLAPGVVVRDARDLEVVADGVTFVFTALSRGLALDHCRNVTVRGLTIDYDPLPFTQGTVTRVAADGASIDVTLDLGYPRELYSRVDVCDPKTRTRKRGMPFLWGTKAAWAGDGVVRVTRDGIGKVAAVGDPVSLSGGPAGGPPHAVAVDFCEGVTLDKVTVHAAPGMGIVECDGEGGARYTGVRVVPGPRPKGATADRLLSTSWDAIQTKSVRRGPVVEGCEVRDAGDDSWSVQSSDFVVLRVAGRVATLALRDGYCDGPQVGDRLRDAAGAEATVTARKWVERKAAGLADDVRAKLDAATPWSFWKLSTRTLEVTLDRDPPFAAGRSVYSPDRIGAGFVFRKNTVHSPGRGALVKAGGVIEDNAFTDCHAAVVVDAEVPDGAASGITGVVVRNNTVTGSGYFCPSHDSPQAGAVSVTGGACPVRDVTVAGNRFRDVSGVCVCLLGVNGAVVRGNVFEGTHAGRPPVTGGKYGVDQTSAVYLDRATNVTLADNEVTKPGPYLKRPLGVGKSTTDVTGVGTGVRAP